MDEPPTPEELETLPRVCDKIPYAIFFIVVAEVAKRFTYQANTQRGSMTACHGRSQCTRSAQNRHGKTQRLSPPNRVAPSDQCACGQARETVEHFLFRCRKWTAYRTEMLRCTDTHRGNVSFYLGGKSPSDGNDWTPNLEAVRATIRFAMITGRLDANQPQDDENA